MSNDADGSWDAGTMAHAGRDGRPQTDGARPARESRRMAKVSRRRVTVGGYVRSDGTYVSGHYRAAR
jgi:hypothetical protein